MTPLELDLGLSTKGGATEDVYDVVIIGGGPAGTSAAIYTTRADLKTVILDKGLTSGAMGTATRIANYPGVPGPVRGADLLQHMHDQGESLGVEYVREKALSATLDGEIKQVRTTQGTYRGRAVIIATGSMGHSRGIAGEERLLGRGVSYCATCDGAFFRDREVAVAGSNEEALEEALLLARFASRVHVLSPTPELKATRDLIQEVNEHPRIELYPSARLREIVGQEQVQAVRFSGAEGEQTLSVDGVFVYLRGRAPITDFLGGQLPTDESGCLLVDAEMQTSIPGVFAVGDVLCQHVKQAVISAAEGAIAGVAVRRYLSGREKLRPDWS